MFYGHLVYLTSNWQCCGHLVIFPRFGAFWRDKSGNPGFNSFRDDQGDQMSL
jgi:hypothetical protein